MISEKFKREQKQNPPNHCSHCETRFDKRKQMIFDDHLWFCELCISCPDRWYIGYDWCQIHYQDVTLEETHYNLCMQRLHGKRDPDD
jgi:hypothetical protein